MLAIARTTRDGLMGEFEFLCIVERDGGLVYQAMPNGRQPATDFALTAMDANSVTFENPMHDFPKMVKYVLQAETLAATRSSGADHSRSGNRGLSSPIRRRHQQAADSVRQSLSPCEMPTCRIA